jgi:diadenosine tetraphosphatase ApaH/serine/threonine PP2A family protein phosphatase
LTLRAERRYDPGFRVGNPALRIPRELSLPTAVISDMHGNAEALRTVLADIEARGVKRIVCLGDIIGYGPEPLECVDLVAEKCEWSLMGNHDFGVLYEPTNFNVAAASAAYWTREQFDAVEDADLRTKRYQFLGQLRVRVVEKADLEGPEILAVHGSPRRPINEYIFPDDVIGATDKMKQIFDLIDGIAIVGHTHVPGVFTDEPDFYPPDEIGPNCTYKFNADEKAIINVGSVGQPRDHDPRASYVIMHPDHVEFIRIDYDIDYTANLIRGIPPLTNWLADRLYEGR